VPKITKLCLHLLKLYAEKSVASFSGHYIETIVCKQRSPIPSIHQKLQIRLPD